MKLPKKNKAEILAKKYAGYQTVGVPFPFSDRVERFLVSERDALRIALQGFKQSLELSDGLEDGYLDLIGQLLEFSRFRVDAGLSQFADAVAQFQSRACEICVHDEPASAFLPSIVAALHRAKLPVSDELKSLVEMEIGSDAGQVDVDFRNLAAVSSDLLKQMDGDVFAAHDMLAGMLHGVGDDKAAALAGILAGGPDADSQLLGLLFLLSGNAQVRAAVAASLLPQAKHLKPESLRRLVMIRNWRPEAERPQIDDIVRRAKLSGVAMPPAKANPPFEPFASGADGAGAQGVILIVPTGRKHRIVSLVLKGQIKDAFATDPISRKESSEMMAFAAAQAALLPVSRDYLNRIICHNIAAGLGQGLVPPAPFLQAAELAGASDWQPQSFDWRVLQKEDWDSLPARDRSIQGLTGTIATTEAWIEFGGLVHSWFLDGDEVAQKLKSFKSKNRNARIEFILRELLAPQRAHWMQFFSGLGMWLKNATAEGLPWQRFIVQAQMLGDELTDIGQFPAMRMIAENTLDAQKAR